MFGPEMINQAREMMEKVKEDLRKMAVTSSAGGGAVTVVVNGSKEITNIEFSEDVPQDRDLLAELVLAAANSAYTEVERRQEEAMPNLENFDFSSLKDLFGK